MYLQEITEDVTHVHRQVKKNKSGYRTGSLLLCTIDMEDSVYCIDMYVAYFYAGDTSIIYLLYKLASLFMLKLYKFHVQTKITLNEQLNFVPGFLPKLASQITART